MGAINTEVRDARFGDKVLLADEDRDYGVWVVVTNEYFHQPEIDEAFYRRVISPLANAAGSYDLGIRVYENYAEYQHHMAKGVA